MTDVTLPDPPTSQADVITLLTIGGASCIKPALIWLEVNVDQFPPDTAGRLREWHNELNRIGYAAEELLGVSDGTFGAGGGGYK